MFDIEKITNKITLTRGDSAELTVELSDELGEYIMQPGDSLTFTMKKELKSDIISLSKTAFGSNIFKFIPADTSELEFGAYYYDIQLTTVEGEVYTVIAPSEFVIGEEISKR